MKNTEYTFTTMKKNFMIVMKSTQKTRLTHEMQQCNDWLKRPETG